MDDEFKSAVVTRIIQMLTPTPSKADIQEISKHFVASDCNANDIYELRQSNKKIAHELQQWRSLKGPIIEQRVSWVTCASYLLLGSIILYIIQNIFLKGTVQ